jgi:hypothetical protein
VTARPVVACVIDCDLCGESLEDGDTVIRFDSHDEGHQAAIDSGWTDLGNGRHACTRTNQAHDSARAGLLAVTQ